MLLISSPRDSPKQDPAYILGSLRRYTIETYIIRKQETRSKKLPGHTTQINEDMTLSGFFLHYKSQFLKTNLSVLLERRSWINELHWRNIWTTFVLNFIFASFFVQSDFVVVVGVWFG